MTIAAQASRERRRLIIIRPVNESLELGVSPLLSMILPTGAVDVVPLARRERREVAIDRELHDALLSACNVDALGRDRGYLDVSIILDLILDQNINVKAHRLYVLSAVIHDRISSSNSLLD